MLRLALLFSSLFIFKLAFHSKRYVSGLNVFKEEELEVFFQINCRLCYSEMAYIFTVQNRIESIFNVIFNCMQKIRNLYSLLYLYNIMQFLIEIELGNMNCLGTLQLLFMSLILLLV